MSRCSKDQSQTPCVGSLPLASAASGANITKPVAASGAVASRPTRNCPVPSDARFDRSTRDKKAASGALNSAQCFTGCLTWFWGAVNSQSGVAEQAEASEQVEQGQSSDPSASSYVDWELVRHPCLIHDYAVKWNIDPARIAEAAKLIANPRGLENFLQSCSLKREAQFQPIHKNGKDVVAVRVRGAQLTQMEIPVEVVEGISFPIVDEDYAGFFIDKRFPAATERLDLLVTDSRERGLVFNYDSIWKFSKHGTLVKLHREQAFLPGGRPNPQYGELHWTYTVSVGSADEEEVVKLSCCDEVNGGVTIQFGPYNPVRPGLLTDGCSREAVMHFLGRCHHKIAEYDVSRLFSMNTMFRMASSSEVSWNGKDCARDSTPVTARMASAATCKF